MESWNTLASDEMVQKTAAVLESNNFTVFVVDTGVLAKEKALALIPKASEVFTVSSKTVQDIGLASEINESGNYTSIRKTFMSMDRNTQKREMQKLGSSPNWVVGSVHAVTQDGHVLIASASGSQLPAYVYGAGHVIWIVGTQKIVSSIADGQKRIYEYVLPLESERVKKAYGWPGSSVNHLLITNKDPTPGRTTIILVKEKLGF